eukprot:1246234-Amphidinium_carterae.1
MEKRIPESIQIKIYTVQCCSIHGRQGRQQKHTHELVELYAPVRGCLPLAGPTKYSQQHAQAEQFIPHVGYEDML